MPKFVYGDIGMWVAPELDLLRDFTFVGVGPFKQLERWGYSIPPGGSLDREMIRQDVGLNTIRHIQYCINDFLPDGRYGLDPRNIYSTYRNMVCHVGDWGATAGCWTIPA